MKQAQQNAAVGVGFTPGPWLVRGVSIPFTGYEIINSARVGIARLPFINEIDTANARLIASAPDLLSACQAVLEWARTPGNHGCNPYCLKFVRLADNAVAKAQGLEIPWKKTQ